MLHALFFGIFSPKGFRSISFVKHKGGIRFCHCNEPIRMWQYRTTCFLPILLLGILPLLYGMATGNYYFTLFGTFLLIGSIDDLCILWKLRSFSKDAFINDCSQELRFHKMCIRDSLVTSPLPASVHGKHKAFRPTVSTPVSYTHLTSRIRFTIS